MKVILCGGGTSGHVNPALNIAETIKKRMPDTEIMFIGTKRGIESTLVPKFGYKIDFVEVSGFSRKLTLKNIKAAWHALTSVSEAKKIIKKFKPDIVIGTGGYVSWPTVKAASKLGIPTLIHEQNAFPGVTTKMLSKVVDKVCISFTGSEKFFEEAVRSKLILTGNPVIVDGMTREEARKKLGLSEDERYVLSYGGSMGAEKVNELVFDLIESFSIPQNIRHTHAIGRVGFEKFNTIAKEKGFYEHKNLNISEYIYDMAVHQAAADVLICRAGAMTLSELAIRGRASVLIPSPHVTEDHQYKNARLIADAGAA
ncbi:MAG: UDP-N-acetylglucosamine--N-acetylmuramyl-(pentapeptide) pyrophosphoryl-undecaprenol N-acetylglucosamine transferase, partial [Clostridia bacterium]|nr:UDP-N-acetylglucosamine--N-acetylmuramyl-(pentapeptide) pyrophosphoryl-undecaprenol N-acetylglucosamine transferase [Clostridia bacterium]